ncbi:MAG TPA: type III-B CRISPR module RAMP protein Cmr4 [Candidatus Dormibacteraeota bacterium]|nr:type III-B CRISPR module RAMP protein Cmr4 [Candidatus Dormibacteraeota bacterium]
MRSRPFLVHALSPLHAGTGHAAELVDLPTARMQSTGIPILPGSSIKGVLRDARREEAGEDETGQARVEAVFGPSPGNDPSAHAGALVVSDARLVALPVRTFRGTFAWATSPLLLALAARDLEEEGRSAPAVPALGPGRRALVTDGSLCLHQGHLYLEDLDLPARTSSELGEWARLLAPLASPGADIFSPRLALVDDETMSFLCETATQVDARVRLDPATRTVATGALWLEESLPPETLLIGLLNAERSRRQGTEMTPEEVLDLGLPREEVVQLGGKATTGHGRCRLIPIPGGSDGQA